MTRAYRVTTPGGVAYVMHARDIQAAAMFAQHWPHVTIRRLPSFEAREKYFTNPERCKK